MMRKITVIAIISLMMVGLFAVLPRISEADESITVTDARGETVTFDTPPERIISFMPSNTEMLFYIGEGDRVVGVDDFSDYPSEVEDLPTVGDSFSVDYENITELEPDVVVTPSFNTQMIDKLEEIGHQVVATNSNTLEDVYTDMKLLGTMCGIQEEVEEMADDLEDEMNEITQNTADLPREDRVDIFYIASVGPIYTPGNNTFQNTLIQNAGGNNIADQEDDWWEMSKETIIDEDPEIIIATEGLEDQVENLTEDEVWQGISAVENDEIYYVNDDIFSRPAPRVVEAQSTLVDITREHLDIDENGQDDNGQEDNEEDVPGFTLPILLMSIAITFTILIKDKRNKRDD
ncbi:MAG: ABC transporter substrate-binding protein [Candidatus Saliniplasma sp.]